VGSFETDGYGLSDTSGNVWEWVSDWYGAGYYDWSMPTDPTGLVTGRMRAVRGGSWVDAPRRLRTSLRSKLEPLVRISGVGVRCARDASS
jgi:formylglycine-generating enzyme required for sulfatase activity